MEWKLTPILSLIPHEICDNLLAIQCRSRLNIAQQDMLLGESCFRKATTPYWLTEARYQHLLVGYKQLNNKHPHSLPRGQHRPGSGSERVQAEQFHSPTTHSPTTSATSLARKEPSSCWGQITFSLANKATVTNLIYSKIQHRSVLSSTDFSVVLTINH